MCRSVPCRHARAQEAARREAARVEAETIALEEAELDRIEMEIAIGRPVGTGSVHGESVRERKRWSFGAHMTYT